MENLLIPNSYNINIEASLARTTSINPKNTVIFYIHGGGFIFGSKDDLPKEYVDLFCNSGYDFFSTDYLLAPESKLDEIMSLLYETAIYFQNNISKLLGYQELHYILFGRSAGCFLLFNLVKRLLQNHGKLPDGIISLYGFSELDNPEFYKPNKHFNQYSAVSDDIYLKNVSKDKLTHGDMSSRYNIYVYNQQHGTWIDSVLGDTDPDKYKITDSEYSLFPYTIMAHSIYDPEVPFRCSKKINQKIKNSTLFKIFDSPEHDFDRIPHKNNGIQLYLKILNQLSEHNL